MQLDLTQLGAVFRPRRPRPEPVMSLIELPPLPWAPDALAPIISKDTIDTHYGKHHKAYVDKTNALIEPRRFENLTLEDIVLDSARDQTARTLFNNAAQVWNHNRYWESLSPDGGEPTGAFAAQIDRDFGGLAKLKEEMVKKGVGHFASGWVWLAYHNEKLCTIDTHDADNALVRGLQPLLVLDVWEHAYYLDYKNERERHLRSVIEELIDWRRASTRFDALQPH
jgi:superoxide dismutase, Fe-Mn family